MNDRLRVYVAAPFELQREAAALAGKLTAAGIAITSRWLTTGDANCDEWARRCLTDVARCDVFVALNPAAWARSGTGGRHVELGYALAFDKPVLLIGDVTNLFHHLAGRVRRLGPTEDAAATAYLLAADAGVWEHA